MNKLRDQNYGTEFQATRTSKKNSSRSQPVDFQAAPIRKHQTVDGSSDEIRKAAILIDSLDDDSTRLFLRTLNLSTARQIHQLAKDLGRVTKEEKENVLAEFLKSIQQISSSEKA